MARIDYLNCEYCKKPMEHNSVVAIPVPAPDGAGGVFKFVHRGECAKATREGRDHIQVCARIVDGELILGE